MATTQSPRTPTKPADLDAPFFNVRETAWLLKCSWNTVRRMLSDGRLGYSQDEKGGAIRISRTDIDAYYNASRIGPRVVHQTRRQRVAA
ncbi:helix-turn-helix domain-containing protein [Streptomyces phaeochromogenes]|uniref:helix-turn-helix domain-containing protein n=1 Tax=Streptomyces phaeochromogenes TaxID=1923 RepID=UPI0036B054B2